MKIKTAILALSLFSTSYTFANLASVTSSLPRHLSQENHNSTKDKKERTERYGNETELKIVHRSDTVKMVAAKTTYLLLVGGTVSSTKKDELKGHEIEDIQDRAKLLNPLFDISKEIKIYEKQIVEQYPDIKKEKPFVELVLKPERPNWLLIYDSTEKDVKKGYSLNFGSTYAPYSVDKRKNPPIQWGSYCTYKSNPYSLEQWKANDYALVSEHRIKAVDQCIDTFKMHLDQGLAKFKIVDAENKRMDSVLVDASDATANAENAPE